MHIFPHLFLSIYLIECMYVNIHTCISINGSLWFLLTHLVRTKCSSIGK